MGLTAACQHQSPRSQAPTRKPITRGVCVEGEAGSVICSHIARYAAWSLWMIGRPAPLTSLLAKRCDTFSLLSLGGEICGDPDQPAEKVFAQ